MEPSKIVICRSTIGDLREKHVPVLGTRIHMNYISLYIYIYELYIYIYYIYIIVILKTANIKSILIPLAAPFLNRGLPFYERTVHTWDVYPHLHTI